MHNANRKCNHRIEKRSIKALHHRLLFDIRANRANSDYELSRTYKWRDWYNSSSLSNLQLNAQALYSDSGIHVKDCLLSIAGGLPPPYDEDMRCKQKGELRKLSTYNIEAYSPAGTSTLSETL